MKVGDGRSGDVHQRRELLGGKGANQSSGLLMPDQG